MLFIGDNHEQFKTYLYILFKMQHKGGRIGVDCSCQLGDMGIGFPADSEFRKESISWSPEIDLNYKFLRGNHDDPAECNLHPNYIGDWGYFPKPDIFFVSGGFSVDYTYRKRYYEENGQIVWWEDEELKQSEMDKVLKSYAKNKPKIVVSHECPLGVKIDFVTNDWKFDYNSRTEKLLHSMFEIHQPDYWIFGHHHQRKEIDKNGTHFVCLDELIGGKINDCIYEIPDLTWEGMK
jgi:hypothetical protein